MKITNCQINHFTRPLGCRIDAPVFSWIVEDGICDCARLEIRTEGRAVYDSGWAKLDPLGTNAALPLLPRTRYEWTVSVKAQSGETQTGETEWFETGKRKEPWQAHWITCETADRLPVFFRDFAPDPAKTLCRARLHLCGLGLYEASLDGRRIGDAWFAPGFYAYDHWLQAQTLDVTDALGGTNGTHRLSVLLGDGWYAGRCNFGGPETEYYGSHRRLLAELYLYYSDGTVDRIDTDERWQVTQSRLTFSGIYDGEVRDDTLPEASAVPALLWDAAAEAAQRAKQGKKVPLLAEVCDNLSLPVRAHEHFKAVLLHTPAGETVLDIGQNMAGAFRLYVHEPKGTRLHLQFGELLQDGNFFRDNLRSAKAEYRYTSDGEEHWLRPHFTFYGYRYVKIEGSSRITAADFDAFALYSDLPMRGTLRTGSAKVNQLISNTVWGMKSNFIDVPTDCPQRDERRGWTGDAGVFSETACWLADPYAFYRKYLYDMTQEQRTHGGMVPDVVPAIGFDRCSSVWGDAACIIPWNLYLFSGDKAILEAQYDSMKSWLAYIASVDGSDHGWRRVFHYGDWLALDCPYEGETQTRGGTDEGFIADVYYRKSALITAKTAQVLGRPAQAEQYRALADRILQGLREEYFSSTGRCCINTQTAALLTLQENLCDAARAEEQLITLLENRDDSLTTGFVGTPLLCPTLTGIGRADKAFKLLLREQYPGWLYEVNLGATTVWERWNSLDENGRIKGTGMNSMNHYAYGAIVGWLWNGAAGLRPLVEKPGFREVCIEPHVNWTLRRLDAVYPSPSGVYKISWELLDLHHIHICIEIPQGCRARVTLPCSDKAPFVLQCGRFAQTYETNAPLARALCVQDTLRQLMREKAAATVLREAIPTVEGWMGFGGDYPLCETMHNLGWTEEAVRALDKHLSQIYV